MIRGLCLEKAHSKAYFKRTTMVTVGSQVEAEGWGVGGERSLLQCRGDSGER